MPHEIVLLHTRDGTVTQIGEHVLVCDCDGEWLHQSLRFISLFAYAGSVAVTLTILLGQAPRAMLAVAVVWTSFASLALLFVRKRKREHGRFVFNFEIRLLEHTQKHTFLARYPFDAIECVLTKINPSSESSTNKEILNDPRTIQERWLMVFLKTGQKFRLGRGSPWALRPIINLLARQGLLTSEE